MSNNLPLLKTFQEYHLSGKQCVIKSKELLRSSKEYLLPFRVLLYDLAMNLRTKSIILLI